MGKRTDREQKLNFDGDDFILLEEIGGGNKKNTTIIKTKMITNINILKLFFKKRIEVVDKNA